ncbi:unnamed protein product [Brassica oleracea]
MQIKHVHILNSFFLANQRKEVQSNYVHYFLVLAWC